MDQKTYETYLEVLRTQSNLADVIFNATEHCFPICVKGTPNGHLNKQEQECFHHCAQRMFHAKQLVVQRMFDVLDQEAKAGHK